MTDSQLQSLHMRIGPNPNLGQNGRLLHILNPLGCFNEWIPLTYNLQILAEYIMENSKLRKKLEDVVGEYVKQLEILAKLRPADRPTCPGKPCNPNAPGANPNYWNAIMSQRMDDLEKRFNKLEELITEKLGP
ncbi:hypothetical protein EUGRSUZ_C03164 [Eucalyptus grandis]|uniref:Uncharacterized protein n=2 Tax=Eucalyptus grandis TaxID=71139 RepID=A0ACC3LJG5_EUCGR|nr:hypothetical protein EUGRSUZ_C03164 [Eucalyptus grandis]